MVWSHIVRGPIWSSVKKLVCFLSKISAISTHRTMKFGQNEYLYTKNVQKKIFLLKISIFQGVALIKKSKIVLHTF